jgi:hypothetical protein
MASAVLPSGLSTESRYSYWYKIKGRKHYILICVTILCVCVCVCVCVCGEWPRSRLYERTAYCETLWWKLLFFFVFPSNEIDRGKPKYSGKNLSQCHFVHHKSHMDGPGIEPGPPRLEAGD